MEYVVSNSNNSNGSSRVKDLQAALFPVQPIPGNAIASQCLTNRYGTERKELDTVLPLNSGFFRCREIKEGFQSLLIDPHVIGLHAVTQEARWPTECQVLTERVCHLDCSPIDPEPFYQPTGKEPRPKPIGDESGSVIFRYCPTGATNYFSRSCIGGSAVVDESNGSSPRTAAVQADGTNRATKTDNTTTTTTTTTTTIDDVGTVNTDLCFESRFESGNLGKVVKITDTFYQLHLRKDLYTQRHTQWYYFRVSNTRSRVMYRLSIVNLCKDDSLYNEGLRPLLYSTKDASALSIGWRRCGENISYYKNDPTEEEKESYTLTFNIYFPHDQDTVYLAHCYPYTYTDLQEYLQKITNDPVKTRFTKLRLLCRSLAGNGVYYLTITAQSANYEARRKKGVVITARVHPGETPSSWIMKGIIDFLTGESNQARELRERFIFKVVPMLNPDGVIVGNNRCSLSGKDLNRQYRTVMRESYPSVWHTKLMIRRLMDECGIAMYCDLHAHSRKHNIFIYGCENKRTGNNPGKLTEQVFPLMLHKNAADKFSFEDCKFHLEKGREGTGRVVVWLMGIQNSYTMEASLGGSKLGSRSGSHFTTQDYEQIGKAFCETLLDFSDNDPNKGKLRNKIIARLTDKGSSADEPTNIELTDYSSDEGDTSDSSSQDALHRGRLNSRNDDRRYLCVPPPSPMLLKPATADYYRNAKRTKNRLPRLVLTRRKARNRKAMDLPTTDPGSDFCDFTDSADEFYVRSAAEMKNKSSDDDDDDKEKSCYVGMDNRQKNIGTSLPVIVRPRSFSLDEDVITVDLSRKNKKRCRHRRSIRALNNTLKPMKADAQIKLMSLRKQIWTGVGNYDDKYDDGIEMALANNYPLSRGVSKMTLEYQIDNETLLELCSRKLEEINYNDVKKYKKKSHKKSSAKKINETTSPPPMNSLDDDRHQQSRNNKKTQSRRKSMIKSSTERLNDNLILLPSGRLDPLKLFGTTKLPKVHLRHHKSDSKRKQNKPTVAPLTTKLKSKLVVDYAADSSSSENSPPVHRKVVKKKIKKTETCNNKRAQSAIAGKKGGLK